MSKDIYGFNEYRPKKKALTVIEVLLIVICAFIVISMLSIYVLFNKQDATPKIFGNNVFVTRATNMEPKIPANSAIFADSDKIDSITPGSVVLCEISNPTSSTVAILRVQQVLEDQDGKASYIIKGDTNSSSETLSIAKDNIIGLCVTYSQPLGKVIVFGTSQMGILCSIIIPCILIIVIQVVHILKFRNEPEDDYDYDDDDDDSDDDNDDDDDDDDDVPEIDENENVLFSTRKSQASDEPRAPVSKRTFIENEGRAVYTKEPTPNAKAEDLYKQLYSSGENPLRRPSAASRQTEEGRRTVYDNFKQKPTASKPVATGYQRMSELSREIHVDSPVNPFKKVEDDYEEPKKLYYEKTPSQRVVLDPPKVENPVGVTIPAEAVKPKETIAPPPKKTNNKTVEELMNMIDQAQKK